MMQVMLLAALGLGLLPSAALVARMPVTLHASDGVTVYADAYGPASGSAPVILLFHQAGSSKSEYAPIAPRLVALGYRALAIDQRSGGDLYAPPNETVAHLGRSAPFEAVLSDMDTALAYVQRVYPGAPVYAWGSSYSAALVFPFAAKHRGMLAAVLAFSPGEYLADKNAVRAAARHVTVPVFIDSSSDPQEVANARRVFAAVASRVKVQEVPAHGIHGSSTLRSDRDSAGAAENWAAVSAFLNRVRTLRAQARVR